MTSSRRSVLLLALLLAGCGGDPATPPVPPSPDDVVYEPFEHGDHSVGELGRARFQVAACAHPEVVEALPSCALDMPFVDDHRTALLVELVDGEDSSFELRSSGSFVVVASTSRQDGRLRALITAEAPGEGELEVRGPAGDVIDFVPIAVREAASLELARIDDDGGGLAVGDEAIFVATLRSAEGEALNAYDEVKWRLGDGDGDAQLYGTRGTRVELAGEAAGAVVLLTDAGDFSSSFELSVQ